MGGRQLAEGGVRAVVRRVILDDVAAAHVLEHLIGIPCALDDEVAVVLEPAHQGLGFGADIVADAFDD